MKYDNNNNNRYVTSPWSKATQPKPKFYLTKRTVHYIKDHLILKHLIK